MNKPLDPGDAAPDAIPPVPRWEWDILADRVTWSDELYVLFGLEPREFRASYLAFIERVHPEDRERVGFIVGQALRDGKSFEFRHRLVRPDGSVRQLHARGEVERDGNGKPTRMLGTTRDVTEQPQ